MLSNFEEITRELNPEEERKLPLVESIVKVATHEKPVTNAAIRAELDRYDIKLGEPRIRKMIHKIRVTGRVKNLVATSAGYYVSEDREELKKYIESLGQRMRSIGEIRLALTTQLAELDQEYGFDFGGVENVN